jgi:hypothetical protein
MNAACRRAQKTSRPCANECLSAFASHAARSFQTAPARIEAESGEFVRSSNRHGFFTSFENLSRPFTAVTGNLHCRESKFTPEIGGYGYETDRKGNHTSTGDLT